MNKRLILLALPAMLLLSSCAVSVQPGVEFRTESVGVSDSPVVDESLGLRGYPGARTVKLDQKRDSTESTFETNATLDAVYNHFHSQLAAQGWQREELDVKRNKIEADYWRGGEQVELKLNREGNSGRYKLSVKRD